MKPIIIILACYVFASLKAQNFQSIVLEKRNGYLYVYNENNQGKAIVDSLACFYYNSYSASKQYDRIYLCGSSYSFSNGIGYEVEEYKVENNRLIKMNYWSFSEANKPIFFEKRFKMEFIEGGLLVTFEGFHIKSILFSITNFDFNKVISDMEKIIVDS